MDSIDLVVILFSIVGLIIPRVIGRYFIEYLAVMTLSVMFVVSLICAYGLHVYLGQDMSAMFIRVFIVMGISNVVFVSGQVEVYQRLHITRQMLEEAVKKQRAKDGDFERAT